MPPRARGFHPLLWTQALTAFHHNQLRSAVVTMAAFGNLSMPGYSPESVVALATILVVAPYVFLSMPAGRYADGRAKASVIRACKLFEGVVALVGAAGLILNSLPLLLLAILLAGIEAATFGPAKFAALPELLPDRELVAGNSWITASSTLAILLGLIAGNLLVLEAAGPEILAAGGIALALFGWLLGLLIPVKPPSAPADRGGNWRDSWRVFVQVVGDRRLALTVFGCSWFWFQGVFSTTLVPLYVAGLGQPEDVVSLLLMVTTIGVTLGALVARLLEGQFEQWWLPMAVALVMAVPALNIGTSRGETMWMVVDFAILSLGTGLFIVPLGMAMQVLGPRADRARMIGVNHLVNGVAMLLAGGGVAALGALSILPATGLMIVGLGTSLVAWIALAATLKSLRMREAAGAMA